MRFPTTIILFYLLILGFKVEAQVKKTMAFSKRNQLCSETIILDSLNRFFKEKGCEGSASVSYGKYKILKGNLIKFSVLSIHSLQPIRKIVRHKENPVTDSSITIILFSREKIPSAFNLNVVAIDKKGNEYPIWSDEKGKIILNYHSYKEIVFPAISSIFGKTVSVAIENSSMDIYFELPYYILLNSQLSFDRSKIQNLVLKNDGLYKTDRKTIVYPLDKESITP